MREETELGRLLATGIGQLANLDAATGTIGATQGQLWAATALLLSMPSPCRRGVYRLVP